MSFIDLAAPSAFLTGSGPWLAAADTLLKVTLLLGVASLLALALARASAAMRHLLWTLALTGALVLPLLSIALPRWQLPIFTVDATPAAAAAGDAVVPAPAPPLRAPRSAEMPASRTNDARPAASSVSEPVDVGASAPAQPVPVTTVLLAIWALGALAVMSRLLLGLAAVQWMWRRSPRVIDAPWLPLARELAADLGISRRLTFLESRTATMPMAFGLVRPAVLMPADAVRWPIERLRIVLLHELAHVKRRDCLTHAIAQVACAVHWFNPLAWFAAKRIRTERERACDDLVLASGTRGPDYAEELLEMARVMRSGRFPAVLTGATLAMAHRSQLEGRLIAILDPKLPRSGVSRWRSAIAAVAMACVLPPLAALQPWVVAAAPSVENAGPIAGVTPYVPEAPQVPGPAPAPAPAPRPAPDPEPVVAGAHGGLAQAHEAVQEVAHAAAHGAIAGKVAPEWSAPPSQWHVAGASIASTVEKVVEGAIEGTAAALAQEAKNIAADPRMIAALTAALKDSDKEVRETAMQALVRMRDPAVFEPLVQALKDAAKDVRESAAFGLGQMRDKRAVEPLMGALKDENADVRQQAAFALGQLRDPRAVDALIAALKDADHDVRSQAAFALSQLRDKRAATALSGLVKDPNPDVRQQAVFALGQIKDVAAVDGLVVALRDGNADVRQNAAFALGQIRDARAAAPLISALKDEDADVRQQAAFGLGQIRDRSAVEALVIALKDPVADVRQQVAFALGQLRDPRAIDGLTNALKDQSADVRQQAAFALGQLIR